MKSPLRFVWALVVIQVACANPNLEESNPFIPPATSTPAPVDFRLHPVGGLPEGFAWRFHEGPDFDVFYGENSSADANAGIYVGYFPGYHPGDGTKVEDSFAGHRIQWERSELSTPDGGKTLRYDALLAPSPDGVAHPLQLHLWIVGRSASSVEALRMALGDVSLETMTSASEK